MENLIYSCYRVQANETLSNITDKLSVSKEIIKKYNSFDENNLEEGDVLLIPKKISKIHIVAPMETLDSIAQKYGISKEKILSKNKIEVLFVGEKLFL